MSGFVAFRVDATLNGLSAFLEKFNARRSSNVAMPSSACRSIVDGHGGGTVFRLTIATAVMEPEAGAC